MATDLKYIKQSVDRIEKRFDNNVNRLEGRMDEISHQTTVIGQDAARAHEAAKSAHARMDEHLKREHGKDIITREEK